MPRRAAPTRLTSWLRLTALGHTPRNGTGIYKAVRYAVAWPVLAITPATALTNIPLPVNEA